MRGSIACASSTCVNAHSTAGCKRLRWSNKALRDSCSGKPIAVSSSRDAGSGTGIGGGGGGGGSAPSSSSCMSSAIE